MPEEQKGRLTYIEVNDLIPHDAQSSEDLEDLITAIGTRGIDVLEAESEVLSSAHEEKFEEVVEAGAPHLPPGTLAQTYDPVRIYLREMGVVPLLTRDEEVDIAKRIARGQLRVLKALSRSPFVIQQILVIGEDLKRGVDYPQGKPANVENSFYWARVKFGLKPTLRVVHVLTMRGNPGDPIAYAIAEKQLYSSHYFETALDLTFCVRDMPDSKQPGFYIVMVMGSEQAGLTGAKGSIVRKAAVGRSVSNLQNALTTIKNALETGH